MKSSLLITALAGLTLAGASNAAIVAGDTIGIDLATPAPVFGSTPNVAPAAGTNFNAFNTQTADGATASAGVGSLIRTSDGAAVAGVDFSVTNNMGKASGLTGVTGQAGPAPFDDATIYEDNYGAANVGNSGRADFGNLPDGANLVFTFSGLDDSLLYTVSGGYQHGNANFNTTWDIDGQSATTDNTGTGYITLSGLSTDGSGNLEITVTKSTQLFVSGLTLEAAVPEPGSMALLGLGGLAMLKRRRRA